MKTSLLEQTASEAGRVEQTASKLIRQKCTTRWRVPHHKNIISIGVYFIKIIKFTFKLRLGVSEGKLEMIILS